MIDLDWNSRNTWNDVIALADLAKTKRLPVAGLVERMILVAALNANVQIASRDQALLKMAKEINVKIWHALVLEEIFDGGGG